MKRDAKTIAAEWYNLTYYEDWVDATVQKLIDERKYWYDDIEGLEDVDPQEVFDEVQKLVAIDTKRRETHE
jgi:hypothetical protein